jgi:hypothetical protein
MAPFNDVSVHIMSAPFTLLHQQTWIGFWQLGHCQVEMMPWCHDWGCSHLWLILTSILDIHSILAPFNDVCGHMSTPLLRYTNKNESILAILGNWVEWKWCHDVMVETVVSLWLLLTSILDIYIGPPAPLQTDTGHFCEMNYFLKKVTHNKNEENTLKEWNEIFLTVYGLP